MIRRLGFVCVLALTGAALILSPIESRPARWADLTLHLYAAAGAGLAGLLLMRFWRRSLGWLVLAAILTTGLGGLIGGLIVIAEMLFRVPGPFGTDWPQPVQLLAMSVALPFMLMVEMMWKVPVWLAGMVLAAWIIRADVPKDRAPA